MSKLEKALVITSKKLSALELCSGAASLAEKVVLVALSAEAAVKADKVYLADVSDSSAALALGAIKELVSREAPQLVITELSRNGRMIAAVIAADNATSVLTDSAELWCEDGRVYSKRVTYGGKAFKREAACGNMAVACVGYSVFPAVEDLPAEAVESLELGAVKGISFLSREEKEVQKIDLGSAKKVVGIGRGIGDGSRMGEIEAFAASIGAEMACTRPVAEEEHLMAKGRYVGVTGCTIKPELYLALGISGVIQHMAGVNSSGTVIAVNKDKNAPIFTQCDYGIVGDMFDVAKQLSEALNK